MTFPCVDCGMDTINEHFMVHDYLWDTAFAGESGEGDICILCIEERLGRKLTKQDFTDVPVNDLSLQWVMSGRMIDRLTTKP